jgi:hypothetical protein
LEYLPVQSPTVEQVGKQMSHVSNFVGFFLENIVISVEKGLKEKLFVLLVNCAEPLCE